MPNFVNPVLLLIHLNLLGKGVACKKRRIQHDGRESYYVYGRICAQHPNEVFTIGAIGSKIIRKRIKNQITHLSNVMLSIIILTNGIKIDIKKILTAIQGHMIFSQTEHKPQSLL